MTEYTKNTVHRRTQTSLLIVARSSSSSEDASNLTLEHVLSWGFVGNLINSSRYYLVVVRKD